ncbi:MAG: HNH endonuclease [Solirubrobacteraceae bacterium]
MRPLRRRAPLAPTPATAATRIVVWPLVAASDAQRAKVAKLRCLVCDRSPVDPAHLVPQRLGGCTHPDCVLPLCRTHHRLYDRGELALKPYLGAGWRRERRHAREHAGATALRRALEGGGWPRADRRTPP